MENSDITITIRIPTDTKEELKKIASINGKKYQSLIKEILNIYIKNYKKIAKEEDRLRDKYRKIYNN